eukprot:CAMPEP_0169254330 /NCGR_PEP_ID=MMETSP1016-20121227/39112_1 /TAXON_ID=342587 /ORGANISM="Karlodinium micrum, Strain CCMP2283" /LENGTH=107 /DNA_ID=CAMNT_0009335773 /DNA_START=176 /DNA_END=499 /DNA_ORIENTATION=-
MAAGKGCCACPDCCWGSTKVTTSTKGMTTALASKEGVGILAATHTIPGAAAVAAIAGASVAAFAAWSGRNSGGREETPYLVVESEEGQYQALPEEPPNSIKPGQQVM